MATLKVLDQQGLDYYDQILLGHVKGDKGDTGPVGTIKSVTATIDGEVGTPSAEASISGEPNNQVISFSFHNLKGETGPSGERGEAGPMGKFIGLSVTADNQHLEQPVITGSINGEPGEQTLKMNFSGFVGSQGEKGDTGNSITSIEKTDGTGDPGTKDTYTIHFDNLEDITFEVYNGKDGEGTYDIVTTEAAGLCPPLPENPYVDE